MRVLYNSSAGSAAEADIDALRTLPGVELVDCDAPDDLIEAAAEAAHAGIDLVVAAGGDGTVTLVVNGLMRAGTSAETRPALGVLPLGTGNDLARTLCLPLDAAPITATDDLRQADRRKLDVMRITRGDDHDALTEYAINACTGGFSGEVGEALTSERKETWGPLAYLMGAAETLPNIQPFDVWLAWDDGPEEPLSAYNVVVANARTAGGGGPVAPRANPEDGLLDVVVVRASANLPRLAARALAGDYLDDDGILHNQIARIGIRTEPAMRFAIDGEHETHAALTVTVVPAALRVCVGGGYQAACG